MLLFFLQLMSAIAIFTVYKQVFWYLNFANHRTKESFVSRANKPLVGTLMTIGDVTMSIAIHIVNESISNQLNKDFSSLKCVIALTLAPLAKTQLKSEFLPILLRVNAYQCCIPFCFSTEQNRTNRVDWVRLGSVIELNRTHKKVPVRLCSIAEPIELQSNDWVRLSSIGFWFDFVRLATPG